MAGEPEVGALLTPPPAATIRIVGIGASAGGLVALEQFLEQTPRHSGLAYIVVQHLDPTQRALLPELLQRVTAMPVLQAEQALEIKPDHVYVIPPNTELRVVAGTLQLAQPSEPRGMRLPINILFSSLALALGERAIAVVLSGMGADGSLGVQAIHAVGGLSVAQEPASAQFDSMPASAIAVGGVDIVAPPGELPARILSYLNGLSEAAIATKSEEPPAATVPPMQSILGLLRGRTRHDFSLYKPGTLQRRMERRMAIHGIHSLALYAAFLERNPYEIELLFKELLIGVTHFFRDPAVWSYLAEVTVPELLARHTTAHHLRAWVIGCSTGEEAYALAMVFCEAVQRLPQPHLFTLQIFASDLSPDAIAAARCGRYPLTISAHISPARLSHFFSLHETYYQINRNIRDMVLFAQHDVVLDPPFTRLDLIACRNLLIYFDPLLQNRLFPLFHYSLRPGGLLLLGSSESAGRSPHLFEPTSPKLRLYRRRDSVAKGGPDFLLQSFPPLSKLSKECPMLPPKMPARNSDNLQAAADRVLLQLYAPAAVLLTGEGDIVYISGRTGKYLEPAAGKANWNIHAMARDGLRQPLALALKQAVGQRGSVQLHGLQIATMAKGQCVDVTVQPLHKPGSLKGMMLVVFRDVVSLGRRERKAQGVHEASHQAELQHCRSEIETLREEACAAQEELQSANEELQSTNEELQSTNEELTTSKEEMQSMNEELQTINSELQSKLDDLALAQSDMQNVLNSIEIAILFLDQKLNVRRYTERASKIVNLRPGDVGRPLSDLTSQLQYPELQDDARETLRTLLPSEKQILTDNGRRFLVRIMPYRRLDNRIDGVVITLVDSTAAKKLERL